MANQYNTQTDSTIVLDELVRRRLRVGDPKNPDEVAKALSDLYPEEKERFARETIGLPFITDADNLSPGASVVFTSPTESDFVQALADLNQDLTLLVSEPALRNVAPGIRGWAQNIRTVVSNGMTAARLALDPGQRDKVFGFRRTLGDYARLARYVGVLNMESNYKYRRLARSIDYISSLIFVQMGEAISKQAMSGFLLQCPLAEIQARRAGVISGLRNLLGSLEAAYNEESWGRGRIGYRNLYNEIELRNQPDLKALLLEAELGRMMNELVDLASRDNLEGLSALGATAGVTIEKMQRLLVVGSYVSQNDPQPPLTAFLEALHLFVEAFIDTRVGLRLVDIARPPISFYGSRYGIGSSGIDTKARTRLVSIAFARGRLADGLDDYLQDDYSNERIQGQIVLDKMLYDADRAIDLYAQGTKDWGISEQRAVAYAILFSAFTGVKVSLNHYEVHTVITGTMTNYADDREMVLEPLKDIQEYLSPVSDEEIAVVKDTVLSQELTTQRQAEDRWLQLVQAVVPSNFP